MKPSLHALAFAFVVSPCVIGCAEEEVQAGQAAFPENVGYTPPSNVPPPPPPNAPAPVQPPPPGGPAAQAGAVEPPDGQGPPLDVAIGGQDGDEYADTDPSALTDFRSALDPYGNWTDDPTYGTVWVPSQSVVGDNFAPYVSGGHWAYDSDYTWVSDYDWGWAPFHYGRWVYGATSWEWIPGRAYAGAWASWRYGSGFVGWAPLPPTWGWRGGSAVGLGFVPTAPYAFVGTEHLFNPGLTAHLVGGPQVGLVAGRTQPWVPASPSVGGLGGHTLAHPAVGGPPPATLHIQSADVARASVSGDRGLAQARAFSRPSTASALGARAPAQVAVRARASSPYMASGRGPAYNQSHFGGKLGAGFSASGPYASPVRSRGFGGSSRPYFGSSSYSGAGHYSGPVRSTGGYSGGAYGGFHGGGEPSGGGGYHGGGGSSEGFHGGGGGSFHSSGGGGGFHGGGGGGHGGGHR
jgi:hypothetical protein